MSEKRAGVRISPVVGGLLALLAACLAVGNLGAQTRYGDLFIEPLDTSLNEASTQFGYAEYRFRVSNDSQRAHRLRLGMPAHGGAWANPRLNIAELAREAEIPAGGTVALSLFHPPIPVLGGTEVAVTVDGRPFDSPLATGARHGEWKRTSNLQVLLSPSASRFEDEFEKAGLRLGFLRKGGSKTRTSGRPAPASPGSPVEAEFTFHDSPLAQWSPRWLAYSRFNVVVVTGPELQRSPAMRRTLTDYASLGGVLVVLGRAPVSENWRGGKGSDSRAQRYYTGFGQVLSIRPEALAGLGDSHWKWLAARARALYRPLGASGASRGATRSQPAWDFDTSLPVQPLFGLMLLFALLMGPVNLLFLKRKGRKVWLWWTVPLISLVATGTLAGFVLMVEGLRVDLQARLVTVLDESERRAYTYGDIGYYATLTPPEGLLFDTATEAIPYLDRGGSASAYRTIDCSRGLGFETGWVRARIPISFMVRKAELRRERLPARYQGRTLEITNHLGADISQVWYCDGRGAVHWGGEIAAGESAGLSPSGVKQPSKFPAPDELAKMFEAANVVSDFRSRIVEMLRPGSYVAFLKDAPFIEPGLQASGTNRFNLVYGLQRAEAVPGGLEGGGR